MPVVDTNKLLGFIIEEFEQVFESGKKSKFDNFSQGMLTTAASDVRKVVETMFKAETLQNVLEGYRSEADKLMQSIISQTKSSLLTLSQFLGGECLVGCQDEVMSAFKSVKERL